MTAEDVARIVDEEIGDQWDRWTAHDLELRRCVVRPPRLERFISRISQGDVPLDLWLVVNEDPDGGPGYVVFYDPEEQSFGLGSRDASGRLSYIGAYGSLWTTLEGM